MESINFVKGLAIGLVISFLLWFAVYFAFNAITGETNPNNVIEQSQPKTELTATNAPI